MNAPAGVSAMMRVKWGLLGEWWCARADASEEECLAAFMQQSMAPVCDRELIRDRLFGGFPCGEDPSGRRHVYFAAGAYTYINPTANECMSEEQRREWWARLIEENGEPGNGPFTNAGPTA